MLAELTILKLVEFKINRKINKGFKIKKNCYIQLTSTSIGIIRNEIKFMLISFRILHIIMEKSGTDDRR